MQSQPDKDRQDASSRRPVLSAKRLVKDPVCGMHLAEEVALSASVNGQTQYFCSAECRAKYESNLLGQAASV